MTWAWEGEVPVTLSDLGGIFRVGGPSAGRCLPQGSCRCTKVGLSDLGVPVRRPAKGLPQGGADPRSGLRRGSSAGVFRRGSSAGGVTQTLKDPRASSARGLPQRVFRRWELTQTLKCLPWEVFRRGSSAREVGHSPKGSSAEGLPQGVFRRRSSAGGLPQGKLVNPQWSSARVFRSRKHLWLLIT